MKLSAAIFFAAAAVLCFAASAGAVDGTIEINQAKVTAAGGFPYVISTANTSYRLTGSLTVPASTVAINDSASNVTIDLNGFSITGPGTTSGAPNGINAQQVGVTVENGTISGFGLGVAIGNNGIIRNVHADANAFGISAGSNGVIEGCTANNSTSVSGFGIYCSAACTISGNTVNGNLEGIECAGSGCVIFNNTADNTKADGIVCSGSGCLVSGNTAFNNAIGIFMSDATTGYGGNVMDSNSTANHSGGTSLGNNLCSGTVC
jgi:parallel beta-helix repeat protein